jgi:hypothetical protein
MSHRTPAGQESAGLPLPTFIVIGGMKCGTTSLHQYLSAHRQISTSSTKELDFFLTEQHLARGVHWYASQFDGGYAVRGESSPNYTKSHLFADVPRRMHAVVPACKLIYLVRDPIDRAVSHYLHNWAAARESRSLTEALGDFADNNYLLTGRYALQLERFLEYYPRSQVLVLSCEGLLRERQGTLSRVFRFLGVDETYDFRPAGATYNSSAKIRRRRSLVRMAEQRSPALVRWARAVLPNVVVRELRKVVTTPLPAVTLDQNLRARLVDYYRDDVQALSPYLGAAEVSDWLEAREGDR